MCLGGTSYYKIKSPMHKINWDGRVNFKGINTIQDLCILTDKYFEIPNKTYNHFIV